MPSYQRLFFPLAALQLEMALYKKFAPILAGIEAPGAHRNRIAIPVPALHFGAVQSQSIDSSDGTPQSGKRITSQASITAESFSEGR